MTAVQAETVYSAAETADAVVLSGFCYCPACVAMAADYLVEIPAEVLAAVILAVIIILSGLSYCLPAVAALVDYNLTICKVPDIKDA